MSEGKISLCVGVFAHNEEKNIEKAIRSIQRQTSDVVDVSEIIVISSGSWDKTNKLVRAMAKKDKRIRLVEEAERRGKSAAINLFFRETKSPVVVTMSGDLRLGAGALEEIGILFLNDEVGMVGAHPVPSNIRFSSVGEEIRVLWELHHMISLKKPKCGEVVAFRNIIREIPKDSAVDEATIEVLLRFLGYSIVYAPRAIVYNKGPRSVRDFLLQRRRIQAGHQWVSEHYNYDVSTMQTKELAQVVLEYVMDNPKDLKVVFRLLFLEAVGRFLGWVDYRVLNKNPYVWKMVKR